LIRRLLSTLLLLRIRKGKKFIFLYHDVSDPGSPQFSSLYSTTIAAFQEQIETFQKKFTFLSIEDLLNKKLPSNKNYAAIVFDDGFYSLYENAFPYLVNKNIPFKIFVNKSSAVYNKNWLIDLEIHKHEEDFMLNYYNNYLLKTKPSFAEFQKYPIKIAMRYFNYSNQLYSNYPSGSFKLFCESKDFQEMLKSGLVTLGSHSNNHFILSQCDEKTLDNEIEENKIFL
jgi:peptidoglycan/xylan/chitin deacetylase (PgdA/CDA1 family)